MLTVTEKAVEQLKEMLKRDHTGGAAIRLYVSGVGWSGPRFGLTLEESIDDRKDLVEEVAGLKFTYEKAIATYVSGKVIDYHTGFRKGFTVNPAVPGMQCGDCSC